MAANRKTLAADAISRKALGDALRKRITDLKLSREAAAKILDDAASQVSRIMHGHDEEFSADRYAKMLGRLGSEVKLVVNVPVSTRSRKVAPRVIVFHSKGRKVTRGRV